MSILTRRKPPKPVVGPNPTPRTVFADPGPATPNAVGTLKAWTQLTHAVGSALPTDARRAVAAAGLYAQAVRGTKRKGKHGR